MHMVRYRVKPDQAAHNEELIRAVLAELEEVEPAGLRYAAFKHDDVSFIHLISNDATDGHSPARDLHALKAFHEGLRERCEDAPVRTALTAIGSYRVFDDG